MFPLHYLFQQRSQQVSVEASARWRERVSIWPYDDPAGLWDSQSLGSTKAAWPLQPIPRRYRAQSQVSREMETSWHCLYIHYSNRQHGQDSQLLPATRCSLWSRGQSFVSGWTTDICCSSSFPQMPQPAAPNTPPMSMAVSPCHWLCRKLTPGVQKTKSKSTSNVWVTMNKNRALFSKTPPICPGRGPWHCDSPSHQWSSNVCQSPPPMVFTLILTTYLFFLNILFLKNNIIILLRKTSIIGYK